MRKEPGPPSTEGKSKESTGKGNGGRFINTWAGGRHWLAEKTGDGSTSVRLPRKRKEHVKLEDILIFNRDS